MEKTQIDLQKDVIEASMTTPILVDFWAPWCGPCRMLVPVLESLQSKAEGKWKLVKINVDENPAIAQQYDISSIPAVKLFKGGKVVNEFGGFHPENVIQEWIEEQITQG